MRYTCQALNEKNFPNFFLKFLKKNGYPVLSSSLDRFVCCLFDMLFQALAGFSCAMAQLLKPQPTEAAPPSDCCCICMEPVLNSDVTLCCDKAMHRVCATGVRPRKHGVRACPLCRSQTFCILQSPTTALTA